MGKDLEILLQLKPVSTREWVKSERINIPESLIIQDKPKYNRSAAFMMVT